MSRSSGPGSSPLTRGKLSGLGIDVAQLRLIPAHAGKTTIASLALRGNAAHPRSRGENTGPASGRASSKGSSPLTRGKRLETEYVAGPRRLIPAHAGKTVGPHRRDPGNRAHPRSRGENRTARAALTCRSGSSPLTRGKQDSARRAHMPQRLIPAHAGKTRPRTSSY